MASLPITIWLYNGPFLCGFYVPIKELKLAVKVKEAPLLYSTSHSRRSGTDHTVLPANYTVPASTS